jgi:hypothetical protein
MRDEVSSKILLVRKFLCFNELRKFSSKISPVHSCSYEEDECSIYEIRGMKPYLRQIQEQGDGEREGEVVDEDEDDDVRLLE